MRVADLIRYLQRLPQDSVVHVDHGEYADNWHPLSPASVRVDKRGAGYTRGAVEGVFLS